KRLASRPRRSWTKKGLPGDSTYTAITSSMRTGSATSRASEAERMSKSRLITAGLTSGRGGAAGASRSWAVIGFNMLLSRRRDWLVELAASSLSSLCAVTRDENELEHHHPVWRDADPVHSVPDHRDTSPMRTA